MGGVISFDLDCTLVDFVVPYWVILSQFKDPTSSGEPPVEWGLDEYDEFDRRFLGKLFRSSWYMGMVAPRAGSSALLNWALENFDTVNIITSREKEVHFVTHLRLSQIFHPSIARKINVYFTELDQPKDSVLKFTKTNVWVDDSMPQCIRMAETPNSRVYMVKQPWNEKVHSSAFKQNIKRVESLTEIITHESELTNGSKEQNKGQQLREENLPRSWGGVRA